MKKPIVVSVIMAFIMLLMGGSFALAQPQEPANEGKPTFYRLTPGIYVNGWPRFTVSYPKDWVERPLAIGTSFKAGAPGPARSPWIEVVVVPWPLPIDKFTETHVQVLRQIGAQDVTVVSDKPSQLRDGTPAREIELSMVLNGIPLNYLTLALKKGDSLIHVDMGRSNEKIGEDLEAIIYSLEFQPGKDEPVKVPSDIQEFLDKWCNDNVSHDVAKVMTHCSDRYLNSGDKKGAVEQFHRKFIGFLTSLKVSITELVPAGDKAYVAGFRVVNGEKWPLGVGGTSNSIIKENGEWKWYGNQRDVSP